jgi:hypothetical protein
MAFDRAAIFDGLGTIAWENTKIEGGEEYSTAKFHSGRDNILIGLNAYPFDPVNRKLFGSSLL